LGDGSSGLAEDIPGMINELFRRLEQPTNHKPQLVVHALGYLAAARYGLSEGELLSVLWQNEDVRQECFAQTSRISNQIDHLPFVLWSRLFFDLQPYFMTRSSGEFILLGFYYRQVAEAARKRYCSGGNETQRHCDLAHLFNVNNG
jgi:hypothetical protein